MPRLVCPSWRWMTIRGTPSRAISTACACRSWCGAKRRRTPAAAAVRRRAVRAAALENLGHASGRGGRTQRPDGKFDSRLEPGLELGPRPRLGADLPAPAALAATDHQRAA